MIHPGIRIGNQILKHVKTRLHSPVSIYGNSEFFVRTGPEQWIKKELELHESIAEMNFPVAKIVGKGCFEGWYYYMEESLGNELLWKAFCRDFQDNSEISTENFERFTRVVDRFGLSQASSLGQGLVAIDFVSGIQAEALFGEAPGLRMLTENALAKAMGRLSVFPSVFSQGDFNPHNIFPKGVIDFDMGFMAPFWYDLVTAIYHTYAFPPKGIAEISRSYVFSAGQERDYFEMVDRIATGAWLPKISGFVRDFLIGRLVWAAVRMHDCPLLQKWRYEKFEAILGMYLDEADFMEFYKG